MSNYQEYVAREAKEGWPVLTDYKRQERQERDADGNVKILEQIMYVDERKQWHHKDSELLKHKVVAASSSAAPAAPERIFPRELYHMRYTKGDQRVQNVTQADIALQEQDGGCKVHDSMHPEQKFEF